MNNPGKILIIRFSSIGDIMLTTPVIRCLKQQTGAEIHYLTKEKYLPLLEHNPYIDRIYTINDTLETVLQKLNDEKYDYFIDLHKNLRSRFVRMALRSTTYSFNKLNFEKWLLVNFKVNRLPAISVVDRYMQAVAAFGVVNDGQGLDYFLHPNFPEPRGFGAGKPRTSNFKLPPIAIGAKLPPIAIGAKPQTSNYVAFAIGAAHQTKRLPTDKIVQICKGLTLPVVLLGGENEFDEGEIIVSQSGEKVANLCGLLSLHESAQLIMNSSLVITHDTGMMHIAAAFQKDILSIWGNTVPVFGMYPYYKKGVERNTFFEVQGLSCRPCSKIGFQNCPKGHFRCMHEQEPEAIINKAESILKQHK